MDTKRAIAFIAVLLFLGLAVADPSGATPARQDVGTNGPTRIARDDLADGKFPGLDEFDPPPPPPSTTTTLPLPPDDPFDRPTAPGGEVTLDPGPRGDGPDTPADPDPEPESEDDPVQPPSGGGKGGSSSTLGDGASQQSVDADTSADSSVHDESAAAEIADPETTDGSRSYALMAMVGLALIGAAGVVAYTTRRNA